MKFRLKLIFALAVAAMATNSSFAQKVVADEIAAIVGHNTILLSDVERKADYIISARKEKGTLSRQTPKEEALETLMFQNVLSQRARHDSLDKTMPAYDNIVEQELGRMLEEAGDISALERLRGKPIYQIRAEISRQVQDLELARMMQSKIMRRTSITYDEVTAYAARIPADSMPKIPTQYSFSKIVKIPPQTDERKYAIREQLLSFRKRILEGEKMSVLARLYSMDGSAPAGGEMGPQSIKSFVGPFAEAIEELKPGQISEIVETEYGLHIIELISYKKPMAHVRHILLKPEFTPDESMKVSQELDSIANQIRLDKLDFKLAAMRYSDDTSSKENGGKSFNLQTYYQTGDIRTASSRYMPDEINPLDYRQIEGMKVGEVSNCYMAMDSKGNIVQQIIRLDELMPAHNANIKDDYDVVESFAMNEKQTKELNEWVNKIIKDMFIEVMPSFRDYKFERKSFDSKKK